MNQRTLGRGCYKTVDGIDYVESRTPSYEGGVPRPTSTPNTGKDVPPKPKKVNKPVLEMLKPTKPAPFLSATTKQKVLLQHRVQCLRLRMHRY